MCVIQYFIADPPLISLILTIDLHLIGEGGACAARVLTDCRCRHDSFIFFKPTCGYGYRLIIIIRYYIIWEVCD